MADMIRIGVVGTNFISDWLCEAVALSGCAEIAGVYSRTAESGAKFAAKHGGIPMFCDFDAFLHSRIDAVYLASPSFCHHDQAIRAMEAGLHVLCEKPAGMNLAQFTEMKECAKRHGVILLEAMRPVFDPALEVIRSNLQNLGKLRYARLDFCQYSSRYDRYLAGELPNAFDPKLSNAAVMDIGVYCAAVATALFGKPNEVFAKSTFLSNGFEGSGTALLQYQGFLAELCWAKTFDSVFPSQINGEKGSISFRAVSKPREITLLLRGGAPKVIPFVPAENNMIYEVREFCSLIVSSDIDHPYLGMTENTLSLLDQIRASASIIFQEDPSKGQCIK